MSMFKKCKVVMLPTNEKARLHLSKNNELFYELGIYSKDNKSFGSNQHLYFLSDEEIKEGDYNVPSDFSKISDISKTSKEDLSIVNDKVNGYKKIIATTDKSLTIDIIPSSGFKSGVGALSHKQTINLPQPSQSFIQKYVEEYNKGNIITDVTVEYEYLPGQRIEADPEIHGIKLKINPKDNTITIRKIKDSWTREEVVNLISRAFSNNNLITNQRASDLDKWIEENL